MTTSVDSGAPDRKSARRRIREFPGKRAVSAGAKSTQALKRVTVNLLWAAPAHSGNLKIRAKMRRYGHGGKAEMQKQRVFQAGTVFSQGGGWAPAAEKCVFPREKRDRYGFHPLKRPGFSLKKGQTMRIHAGNTRVQSQTAHKAPKARRSIGGFTAHEVGPKLDEDLRTALPPLVILQKPRMRRAEQDVNREAVLVPRMVVLQVQFDVDRAATGGRGRATRRRRWRSPCGRRAAP